MRSFLLLPLYFIGAVTVLAVETPAKPPLLTDPELRVEALAAYPDVETPTTVTGAPDGAVYVGNDPRDSRLNTDKPECTIVRFSSLGADRKKTVFADKLYSPAGMLWHDGWLYVIHDPLLTRFKDTNGTGVADVREDLVTDLGQPPHEGLNDHVVSGFTLGHGWLLLHQRRATKGSTTRRARTAPRSRCWAAASCAAGPMAPGWRSTPAARAITWRSISTRWIAPSPSTIPTTETAGGRA